MAESETDSPSIVETTTAKTTASELKNDTNSSKAETVCSSSLSFAALFPKSEDSEKETMATTTTAATTTTTTTTTQLINCSENTLAPSTADLVGQKTSLETSMEVKSDAENQEERRAVDHSSQSSGADSGDVAKGDDADFDPSSEMQDYDDEAVKLLAFEAVFFLFPLIFCILFSIIT